jgi:hypothetical protein
VREPRLQGHVFTCLIASLSKRPACAISDAGCNRNNGGRSAQSTASAAVDVALSVHRALVRMLPDHQRIPRPSRPTHPSVVEHGRDDLPRSVAHPRVPLVPPPHRMSASVSELSCPGPMPALCGPVPIVVVSSASCAARVLFMLPPAPWAREGKARWYPATSRERTAPSRPRPTRSGIRVRTLPARARPNSSTSPEPPPFTASTRSALRPRPALANLPSRTSPRYPRARARGRVIRYGE